MDQLHDKRPFARTGIEIPPIIFGSSAMGNLYRAMPYEEKRSIAEEWFRTVASPVVIDSAGKYGAGLALETIGRLLHDLGVSPSSVILSNKLGWKRVPLHAPEPTFEPGVWKGLNSDAEQAISYTGILECWEQGCELLGGDYRPALVSVHDPDEFLSAASDSRNREARFEQVLEAYRGLDELKSSGAVAAVGVGAKDWRVIREIDQAVDLDWVMLACSLTVQTHVRELLEFVASLRQRGIGIVNSAVFNSGFLIGGEYYNYRKPDPVSEEGLFRWRDGFLRLCHDYSVKPSDACVEFGLSAPGVSAVALNTGNPRHVTANVQSVLSKAPSEFWQRMKIEHLIDADYSLSA